MALNWRGCCNIRVVSQVLLVCPNIKHSRQGHTANVDFFFYILFFTVTDFFICDIVFFQFHFFHNPVIIACASLVPVDICVLYSKTCFEFLLLKSNVIKFYTQPNWLMQPIPIFSSVFLNRFILACIHVHVQFHPLLRVVKDEKNSIGKIKIMEYKKIYSLYIGMSFLKSYTNLQQRHTCIWLSLAYTSVLYSRRAP